jgi:molecular chaperone GrpE
VTSGDRPEEPVVITDKRKVDREAAASAPEPGAEAAAPAEPELDENAKLLAERTADLQRLQAEYANYRKRAERERLSAGEMAISRTLIDFLPVLDNLDRAEEHGDLTGGLKAVAEQLIAIFGKLGLVSFGQEGDPFDPSIHEAVLHDESEHVDVPTCTTVMRPGYKHNDRLLRPAMVGVSDPVQEPNPKPTAPQESDEPEPEPGQANDEPPEGEAD